MLFPVEQLKLNFEKKLLPVYFFHGEEPQQLTEALDLIRTIASSKGFSERITLFTESRFDWTELNSALDISPLFSSKTVVDLRLTGNQPNNTGSAILKNYLSKPNPDIILLLSAEKLSKTVAKASWLKQIKSVGLVQQFKPFSGKQLLEWLTHRAHQKGLCIERDSINLLAARVEGNQLAAAQEIDKLYLDYGQKKLTSAEIEQWVADQSRYDVFAWVESTLEGRLSRSQRILTRMKLEGIAPVLVIWAITRELRLLIKLSEKTTNPGPSVFQKAGVWGKRKQVLQSAMARLDHSLLLESLKYCSYIDRVVKGSEYGNAWQCLSELCSVIANAPKQVVTIELRDQLSLKFT
ncbi:MAG TPA: DNA polymerase III subunit delta [Crenotrichaceae bacterium]|nr:DNA polymerase III subunit delta [Crenotrichaceae bacterium]